MFVWILIIILCVVAILICGFILKRECTKRKNQKTKDDDKNIYLKWLDFWSLLTIILCVGSPFFELIAVINSNLCFINKISELLNSNMAHSIILYQISRLQYCFYSKQIHSKQYGYPKSLFIFLYCYGACLTIYTIVAVWISSVYVPSNHHGCIRILFNTKLVGINTYIGIECLHRICCMGLECTFLIYFQNQTNI